MTRKFQTINQVRKFLQENGSAFRGIYGEVYTLANGRKVEFKDRAARNCWGISSEATEMVEAAR
jgi:hypothetical protein